MANKAASLIRYAKLEGIGWRRGNLIKAKNGRYRPDSTLVATIPTTNNLNGWAPPISARSSCRRTGFR